MPYLPSYLQPLHFGLQMWHLSSLPHIYLSFYIFAIHLHGANLCKSIFSSSESCQTVNPVIKTPRVVFSTFYLSFSHLFLNQIIVHSGQHMINWNERVLLKFFWAILQIAATSNLNLVFGQTNTKLLLVFGNITCFLRCLSLYRGCLSLYERS